MTKIAHMSLVDLYNILQKQFGPRNWWPADSPFEVIIGAILTQNTAWVNVETALSKLKQKNLLTPEQLEGISRDELADNIRSSGYYNQKALKIKAFLEYFKSRYQYKLERMAQEPLNKVRNELLAVFGIGEETADSILLYALHFPTFVVDAYTIRILSRIGFLNKNTSYKLVKELIEASIPRSVAIFNEFHALFVTFGRTICLPKPKCTVCPVKKYCQYYLTHVQ